MSSTDRNRFFDTDPHQFDIHWCGRQDEKGGGSLKLVLRLATDEIKKTTRHQNDGCCLLDIIITDNEPRGKNYYIFDSPIKSNRLAETLFTDFTLTQTQKLLRKWIFDKRNYNPFISEILCFSATEASSMHLVMSKNCYHVLKV